MKRSLVIMSALLISSLSAAMPLCQFIRLMKKGGPAYGTTSANPGLNCQDILTSVPSSTSGGGYWVTSNGHETAFNVYCDMTSNGGGWTFVEVINLSDHSVNRATGSVTPGNLTDITKYGKYSDTSINNLKSSTDPGYWLNCGAAVAFFKYACVLASGSTITDANCYQSSLTYPPGSYTGSNSGDNGLGDDAKANNATYDAGGTGGCYDGTVPGYRAGTLYVR